MPETFHVRNRRAVKDASKVACSPREQELARRRIKIKACTRTTVFSCSQGEQATLRAAPFYTGLSEQLANKNVSIPMPRRGEGTNRLHTGAHFYFLPTTSFVPCYDKHRVRT